MSEDESKRDERAKDGAASAQHEDDAEDRESIFARRKLLVSAALAGVAMSTAGCDQLKRAIGIESNPQPCLSPPPPPPQVCLSFRPPEPQACLSVPIEPQVCLSPRIPEEITPDAGAELGVPGNIRPPGAQPCLAPVRGYRDPPRTCLSVSRSHACLSVHAPDDSNLKRVDDDDES